MASSPLDITDTLSGGIPTQHRTRQLSEIVKSQRELSQQVETLRELSEQVKGQRKLSEKLNLEKPSIQDEVKKRRGRPTKIHTPSQRPSETALQDLTKFKSQFELSINNKERKSPKKICATQTSSNAKVSDNRRDVTQTTYRSISTHDIVYWRLSHETRSRKTRRKLEDEAVRYVSDVHVTDVCETIVDGTRRKAPKPGHGPRHTLGPDFGSSLAPDFDPDPGMRQTCGEMVSPEGELKSSVGDICVHDVCLEDVGRSGSDVGDIGVEDVGVEDISLKRVNEDIASMEINVENTPEKVVDGEGIHVNGASEEFYESDVGIVVNDVSVKDVAQMDTFEGDVTEEVLTERNVDVEELSENISINRYSDDVSVVNVTQMDNVEGNVNGGDITENGVIEGGAGVAEISASVNMNYYSEKNLRVGTGARLDITGGKSFPVDLSEEDVAKDTCDIGVGESVAEIKDDVDREVDGDVSGENVTKRCVSKQALVVREPLTECGSCEDRSGRCDDVKPSQTTNALPGAGCEPSSDDSVQHVSDVPEHLGEDLIRTEIHFIPEILSEPEDTCVYPSVHYICTPNNINNKNSSDHKQGEVFEDCVVEKSKKEKLETKQRKRKKSHSFRSRKTSVNIALNYLTRFQTRSVENLLEDDVKLDNQKLKVIGESTSSDSEQSDCDIEVTPVKVKSQTIIKRLQNSAGYLSHIRIPSAKQKQPTPPPSRDREKDDRDSPTVSERPNLSLRSKSPCHKPCETSSISETNKKSTHCGNLPKSNKADISTVPKPGDDNDDSNNVADLALAYLTRFKTRNLEKPLDQPVQEEIQKPHNTNNFAKMRKNISTKRSQKRKRLQDRIRKRGRPRKCPDVALKYLTRFKTRTVDKLFDEVCGTSKPANQESVKPVDFLPNSSSQDFAPGDALQYLTRKKIRDIAPVENEDSFDDKPNSNKFKTNTKNHRSYKQLKRNQRDNNLDVEKKKPRMKSKGTICEFSKRDRGFCKESNKNKRNRFVTAPVSSKSKCSKISELENSPVREYQEAPIFSAGQYLNMLVDAAVARIEAKLSKKKETPRYIRTDRNFNSSGAFPFLYSPDPYNDTKCFNNETKPDGLKEDSFSYPTINDGYGCIQDDVSCSESCDKHESELEMFSKTLSREMCLQCRLWRRKLSTLHLFHDENVHYTMRLKSSLKCRKHCVTNTEWAIEHHCREDIPLLLRALTESSLRNMSIALKRVSRTKRPFSPVKDFKPELQTMDDLPELISVSSYPTDDTNDIELMPSLERCEESKREQSTALDSDQGKFVQCSELIHLPSNYGLDHMSNNEVTKEDFGSVFPSRTLISIPPSPPTSSLSFPSSPSPTLVDLTMLRNNDSVPSRPPSSHNDRAGLKSNKERMNIFELIFGNDDNLDAVLLSETETKSDQVSVVDMETENHAYAEKVKDNFLSNCIGKNLEGKDEVFVIQDDNQNGNEQPDKSELNNSSESAVELSGRLDCVNSTITTNMDHLCEDSCGSEKSLTIDLNCEENNKNESIDLLNNEMLPNHNTSDGFLSNSLVQSGISSDVTLNNDMTHSSASLSVPSSKDMIKSNANQPENNDEIGRDLSGLVSLNNEKGQSDVYVPLKTDTKKREDGSDVLFNNNLEYDNVDSSVSVINDEVQIGDSSNIHLNGIEQGDTNCQGTFQNGVVQCDSQSTINFNVKQSAVNSSINIVKDDESEHVDVGTESDLNQHIGVEKSYRDNINGLVTDTFAASEEQGTADFSAIDINRDLHQTTNNSCVTVTIESGSSETSDCRPMQISKSNLMEVSISKDKYDSNRDQLHSEKNNHERMDKTLPNDDRVIKKKLEIPNCNMEEYQMDKECVESDKSDAPKTIISHNKKYNTETTTVNNFTARNVSSEASCLSNIKSQLTLSSPSVKQPNDHKIPEKIQTETPTAVLYNLEKKLPDVPCLEINPCQNSTQAKSGSNTKVKSDLPNYKLNVTKLLQQKISSRIEKMANINRQRLEKDASPIPWSRSPWSRDISSGNKRSTARKKIKKEKLVPGQNAPTNNNVFQTSLPMPATAIPSNPMHFTPTQFNSMANNTQSFNSISSIPIIPKAIHSTNIYEQLKHTTKIIREAISENTATECNANNSGQNMDSSINSQTKTLVPSHMTERMNYLPKTLQDWIKVSGSLPKELMPIKKERAVKPPNSASQSFGNLHSFSFEHPIVTAIENPKSSLLTESFSQQCLPIGDKTHLRDQWSREKQVVVNLDNAPFTAVDLSTRTKVIRPEQGTSKRNLNQNQTDLPLDLTAPKMKGLPSKPSPGKPFLNPSPCQSPFNPQHFPIPQRKCVFQTSKQSQRTINSTTTSTQKVRLDNSQQTIQIKTENPTPKSGENISLRSLEPQKDRISTNDSNLDKNNTYQKIYNQERLRNYSPCLPSNHQRNVTNLGVSLTAGHVGQPSSGACQSFSQNQNNISSHSPKQPAKCLEKLIISDLKPTETGSEKQSQHSDSPQKKSSSSLGLPVQDFFKKSSFENSYSSMMMAKRTSQQMSQSSKPSDNLNINRQSPLSPSQPRQQTAAAQHLNNQYFSNQILGSIFAQNSNPKPPVVVKSEKPEEMKMPESRLSSLPERRGSDERRQCVKFDKKSDTDRQSDPLTMRLPIVSPQEIICSSSNISKISTPTYTTSHLGMSGVVSISRPADSLSGLKLTLSCTNRQNPSPNRIDPVNQSDVVNHWNKSFLTDCMNPGGDANISHIKTPSSSSARSQYNPPTPIQQPAPVHPAHTPQNIPLQLDEPPFKYKQQTTQNISQNTTQSTSHLHQTGSASSNKQIVKLTKPSSPREEFVSQANPNTTHTKNVQQLRIQEHSGVPANKNMPGEATSQNLVPPDFLPFQFPGVLPFHLNTEQGVNSNVLKLMQFRAPVPKKHP